MRTAFVQELSELANNPRIMLLTADLGFEVFEEFAHLYPKQFLNVGDAEANMMGLAAGLALSGKIVFAYSIATFSTLRPYEQIRNDICHHDLPVVVVGSGAGLSYGDNSSSHYAIEDVALMRALPKISILCPADPIETKWAVRESARIHSPVYLRIGRRGEPKLYTDEPRLQLGRGHVLRDGDDFALLATGNIVANVLEAAEILERNGLRGSVISMHSIRPFDRELVLDLAKRIRLIVTVEEHIINGGLGSMVAEILAESATRVSFKRIGLPGEFPKSVGSQQFLRERFGLSPEKIALSVVNELAGVNVKRNMIQASVSKSQYE